MPKIILALLLTAWTTSPIATKKRTLESEQRKTKLPATTGSPVAPSVQPNVTFAFAVARTDQADSFLEFKVIMAMAMGPAFVPQKTGIGLAVSSSKCCHWFLHIVISAKATTMARKAAIDDSINGELLVCERYSRLAHMIPTYLQKSLAPWAYCRPRS